MTFLFTDVEGSTRLNRALGYDAYEEVLAAHHTIMRRAVAGHGGVVIRTEGDGFFCAFTDPGSALAACLEAQQALGAERWPAGAELRVRMGLHTGEAEPAGDDYIALAVNQAARVSAAAHGAQVLVSEATRQLVGDRLPGGASLRPLGRYRLKDFSDPALLHQLLHPALPSDFPPVRTLPAAAHNIPEQATLFVGRRTALAELAKLVTGRRLVSVLGAGGVGKTRLATELVPIVVSKFADGVWLIELARLGRCDDVASEVAATLGVRAEAERDAVDTVADALVEKRLLLILDNCEHVLDSTAKLVDRLIGRCPDVSVLTTSREPLGVHGEQRFPLAPLTVPGGPGADPEGSEAVALFVDRARAVSPGFELAREREAVVEICGRLDGLPLAIELAAARAAAIPLGHIVARLDRRFSVLKQTYRGALSHHETLRGSIEWSYDLLDAPEKVLVRRLGVFTAEFDLEAAEAICAGPPLEQLDILDLLARLVEKSLVQQSDHRCVLLESIREFARERLQEVGELDELAQAHLTHYTNVVETAAGTADGPQQRAAYDRLDADLANVRAAVELALANSDPAALRLGAALGQYGFIRNRLAEVARWCIDATAAAPDAPAALRARALAQAGFALVVMGSAQRGQALVDDGLALARSVDDPPLLVEMLLMAADLRLEIGRSVEARPLAREALELARTVGEDWPLGRALAVAARAEEDELGYAETHQRLAQALELFERVDDRRQVARVSMTMAYLSLGAGALDAAEAEAARCIAITGELEHPIGVAIARVVQVWVAIRRGESAKSRALLSDTIATARDSGYVALLGYCAAARAALLSIHGEDGEAARMLGALAETDALGGEGGPVITRRVELLRGELRGRLGPDQLDALMAEGSRLTLEQIAAMPL